MAPRVTQLPKQGKRKSKKVQEPEEEPEFLEAADELEKSGGKWRAGDAAKAARFFRKAIDVYNAGLLKYPSSFDLAYNKALLQYHISEEPRIASQFGETVDLLRETLESHRKALRLNPDNADILFNTAQTLTSLADALDDDEESKAEQVRLVQESVELFAACLSRQELDYSDRQAMLKESSMEVSEGGPTDQPDGSSGNAEMPSETASAEQVDDWATVVEATTPNTLLETALAELEALTALAGLSAPADQSTLTTLSGLAATLTREKIPAYIALLPVTPPAPPPIPETASLSVSATSATFNPGATGPTTSPQEDAQNEARLTAANWEAAMAGAEFRSRLIGARDYASRVHDAFSFVTAPLASAAAVRSVDELSAFADALIDFDSATVDGPQDGGGGDPAETQRLRWTALSTAQDLLKEASETLGAKKSSIYLARGDVDFRRSRLASGDSSSNAEERVKLLLSNAAVYYRGASALANQANQTGKDERDELEEAEIKMDMVQYLAARMTGVASPELGSIRQKGITGEKVRNVFGEMVDEGMIDDATAQEYLTTVEDRT